LVIEECRCNFVDHAEKTPMLKMYTLGHKKEVPTVYAEGLRYHATAPIISLLRHKGIIDAVAYPIGGDMFLKETDLLSNRGIFAST